MTTRLRSTRKGKFQWANDQFDNVDPMDYRYWSPEMARFWSENAGVRYRLLFEVALVDTFADYGICDRAIADEVRSAAGQVRTIEVYQGEEETGHDIDGLTGAIRRKKISEESSRLIHLGATSYDTICSGEAARHRDGTKEGVIPLLLDLERAAIEKTLRFAKLAQIGRSHLRHGVPITFGYWAAGYVERIGAAIELLECCADQLPGKACGPVGAANAFSTFIKNPIQFERDVLAKMGLNPAMASRQIVPPYPMFRLYCAFVETAMAIANLGTDIRHLAMTEVGEVLEPARAKKATGSSAMPHKSVGGGNPVVSENAYGSSRIFAGLLVSVASNSISDLARDLGDSMVARFFPLVPALLMYETKRMARVMAGLRVNEENIQRNLKAGAAMMGSEALYIRLSLLGLPRAHSRVADLCIRANENGGTLCDEFMRNRSLARYRSQMTDDDMRLVADPTTYTGVATEKAVSTATTWADRLGIRIDPELLL